MKKQLQSQLRKRNRNKNLCVSANMKIVSEFMTITASKITGTTRNDRKQIVCVIFSLRQFHFLLEDILSVTLSLTLTILLIFLLLSLFTQLYSTLSDCFLFLTFSTLLLSTLQCSIILLQRFLS